MEFRQAVAETGKKLGLRHRRRFHGAHKAVDPERRPRCSVSRKIRLHRVMGKPWSVFSSALIPPSRRRTLCSASGACLLL